MTAGFTIVVARILQITLYAKEFIDQVLRDGSTAHLAFRLHFFGFNKLAPRVSPATQTFHSGLRAQRALTGVIIGHHVATIIHRAGVSEPSVRGWWSSQKGSLAYLAGRRYAHTSRTGCLGLGQAHSFITVDITPALQAIAH